MTKYICVFLLFFIGCTSPPRTIKTVEKTILSDDLIGFGNLVIATDGSTIRSMIYYSPGIELEAAWQEPKK